MTNNTDNKSVNTVYNKNNNMIHISFKNSPYEIKLFYDILKSCERLGQSAWCKDVIAEKLYGGLDLDSKNTQEVYIKKKEAEYGNVNDNKKNNTSNYSVNNINTSLLQSFADKSFLDN